MRDLVAVATWVAVAVRVISVVLFVLVLGVLGAPALEAAQIEYVTVETEGNAFHITLDAVLDATQVRVYGVLSDYAHLNRMNPTIRSVSLLPAPGKSGIRVRSVLDGCVWFFCRQIVQVEDVTEPDPYTIVGQVVPGEGDFAVGSFSWRVTTERAGTRVHYEALQTPKFWIPPLIGPWAIARTLRSQFTSSVALLEHLAKEPESSLGMEAAETQPRAATRPKTR